MPVLLACSLVLAVISGDDPKLDGDLHIESKVARRIEVTLTEQIDAPGFTASRWSVAAALPPSFEGQTVKSATMFIPGYPTAAATRRVEKSQWQQPYLLTEFTPVADSMSKAKAQAIYDVTLYQRDLVEGKSPEVPFPLGAKRAKYLASSRTTPLGGADFSDWLTAQKLRKESGERDLKFAWRVFKHLSEHFEFTQEEVIDALPETTIAAGKSNSPGIVNLFVAVLRANDIPARAVTGIDLVPYKDRKLESEARFIDEETSDTTAEFWAEGIGWVPADPTHALGYWNPAKYFAHDPGEILAMHFEQIVLQPDLPTTLERMRWILSQGAGAVAQATVTRKLEVETK